MRNILILGDSYSTFEGCIPEGYATYYPALDVTRAEQTWWSRVLRATGARLAQNNSWSGSTVCHTAYDGVDCFRCYFGGGDNDTVDVPRGEFEKKESLRMEFLAAVAGNLGGK